MATIESIKAKIQGLIDKANRTTSREDTQLTPAVDALIAGYGSGGGGFVDVTELPNISEAEEGVVYRLVAETPPSADIYVGINTGDSNLIMTLENMFAQEGITASTSIKIVSELPETMDVLNEATFTIPMYIVESTGIAYISIDGTNVEVYTLGQLFDGIDAGWAEHSDQILPEEIGVIYFYSMRSEAKTEIKGLYLAVDGEWEAYREIIDVEELPTVDIKKNAIYRVGTYLEQNLYKVFAGGEIKPLLTWLEETEYGDNVTFNKVEFVDSIPSPHEPTTAYVNTSGLWVPDGDDGLTKWSNDDPLAVLLFGSYWGLCDADEVDLGKAGLYAVREGMIVDKYCVRIGGVWKEYKSKSIFQEYVNGDLTELKADDLSGIYRISDYALANCKTLEKVTFSPSNGVIGNSAFEGCENLKEVNFHDAILGIGSRAFYGCKSITEIDWYSLRNLWDIHERAFAYCTSLKSAHLECTGYLWTVGDGLFEGCTSLESAEFSFGADGGWQNISSIFKGCTSLKSVALQGNLMGDIPHYMFEGCSSLTDIYFKNATKSSWKNTAKGAKWDRGTPDYVIHCTDGDILKSDPESGSDDTPDVPVVPDVPKVVEKDVNFYDYDGTLLHSYTVEEAQALTELPPLPTQPGLICQGWNYDLETIKSHNRALDIGATYITDDGKTRLYINVASEYRKNISLNINQFTAYGVDIDWGDGSPIENNGTSGKVTFNHEYATTGEYVISITRAKNDYNFALGHGSKNTPLIKSGNDKDTIYRNMLTKVELGDGVQSLSGAFASHYNLKTISIPNPNLSGGYKFQYGDDAFYYCYSLLCVVFPRGGYSIIGTRTCQQCTSLEVVSIPNDIETSNNYAFSGCGKLKNITFPQSIKSFGGESVYGCYNLKRLIIPEGVTVLSNVFSKCWGLKDVVLPESLTSLSSSTFYNCYGLPSIRIPKSVTSIGSSVFGYCGALKVCDFSQHESVPTLSSTNAFTGIPADCEIRVPAALVDEWKAATNWSTYASQIVGV